MKMQQLDTIPLGEPTPDWTPTWVYENWKVAPKKKVETAKEESND